MADYPDISLLSDLDPLTPAGTEVASKADDAIRQVKKFLTTFLAVSLNANGTLKNSSVILAAVADALITYAKIQNVSTTDRLLGRQTAGAGVIEEIVCTAAGRALIDDTDAAAQRTTLGLGAMALAADVATANLQDGSVTAPKLASDSVTTVKILAANVTEAKIADGNVSVGKLKWAGGSDAAPTLMVKGTAAAEMTIGGVLTATVVGTTLTFALAGTTAPSGTANTNIGYARLAERAASGTGAGGTSAAAWVDRGNIDEVSDPLDMVSTSSNAITFKKKGVYLIDIWCPCSGAVGFHRSRLYNVTASAVVTVGTSSQCPAACTTMSHIREIIEVSADNTVYKLQTWATNAVATTGLGAPCTTGDQEIYSIVEIFKLN